MFIPFIWFQVKYEENFSNYCCNPLGVHKKNRFKSVYEIPDVFATKYAEYNLVSGQKICKDCIMNISSNVSIFLYYYCLIRHYLLEYIIFHQTKWDHDSYWKLCILHCWQELCSKAARRQKVIGRGLQANWWERLKMVAIKNFQPTFGVNKRLTSVWLRGEYSS